MKPMTGYFLSELDYNTVRDVVVQLKDMVGDSSLDDDILDELMEVVDGATPIFVQFDDSAES